METHVGSTADGCKRRRVPSPDYPRVQIVTVQQLLDGATVKMPPSAVTFKQAGKMLKEDGEPQLGFTFAEKRG